MMLRACDRKGHSDVRVPSRHFEMASDTLQDFFEILLRPTSDWASAWEHWARSGDAGVEGLEDSLGLHSWLWRLLDDGGKRLRELVDHCPARTPLQSARKKK